MFIFIYFFFQIKSYFQIITINFDINMMIIEGKRNKIPISFGNKLCICTMKSNINFCNIIKLNKDLLLISYNEYQDKYNKSDKFINILSIFFFIVPLSLNLFIFNLL